MSRADVQRIAHEAERAASGQGFARFKWTCLGCHQRVTFEEANAIYTKAEHTEKLDGSTCGYVTDLVAHTLEADLGYQLVLVNVKLHDVDRAVASAMQRRDAARNTN